MGKPTGEHSERLKKMENYHDKGCVIKPCSKKGHRHRENCYNYAKSSKLDRDLYNRDFTKATGGAEFKRVNRLLGRKRFRRSKKWDPRDTKDAWWLGNGPYAHLNYWYKPGGGFFPFLNAAHHILPAESLHEVLDFWELRALQECGYNINAGENLIFLPREKREAKVMELIYHPGGHSTYNSDVQTVIEEIKTKFSEARDPEGEGHGAFKKKNMQNLRDWLIQWSIDELADTFIEGREGPGKKR
jgi:hypothetical protein